MATDLWGLSEGILIVSFLLSKFEQRSLNVAASSCVWGYFGKHCFFFIPIKIYNDILLNTLLTKLLY